MLSNRIAVEVKLVAHPVGNERKEEPGDNTGDGALSGQHAHFEEESGGEPSSQLGSADVAGRRLQALCLTLISAYGSNASPRKAHKSEE